MVLASDGVWDQGDWDALWAGDSPAVGWSLGDALGAGDGSAIGWPWGSLGACAAGPASIASPASVASLGGPA